jgi:uncharacterized protein YbaR (Trm112 family)
MTPERKGVALAPELKEILACPKCKGELEFREAEAEIRCARCRLVYRIDDGIPVMLVEEARGYHPDPARRARAEVRRGRDG